MDKNTIELSITISPLFILLKFYYNYYFLKNWKFFSGAICDC